MTKRVGFGSILTCTSSTGTLTIGQIRSIDGPSGSGTDVDTTTLDSSSNFRTFSPGPTDPGELTLDLVYDKALNDHGRLGSYYASQVAKTWTVTDGSSTGPTRAFSGYIKSMGAAIPLDDVITCSVTIKVSGVPGFSS